MKYYPAIVLFGLLALLGCKNNIVPNLESTDPTECEIFISNLRSDYYAINEDCNTISNVTMVVDTVYNSSGYTLDTTFVYEYTQIPNRTKQALIFDYHGDCINKSTYFQVSYEIAAVTGSYLDSMYQYTSNFAPIVYNYGSYGNIGNKIRLGVCWPIYGFDVVVTYRIQGFHEGQETNMLEASFTREEFM